MFKKYSEIDFNIIKEAKKRVEDKITKAKLNPEQYPEETELINIINNQLKIIEENLLVEKPDLVNTPYTLQLKKLENIFKFIQNNIEKNCGEELVNLSALDTSIIKIKREEQNAERAVKDVLYNRSNKIQDTDISQNTALWCYEIIRQDISEKCLDMLQEAKKEQMNILSEYSIIKYCEIIKQELYKWWVDYGKNNKM